MENFNDKNESKQSSDVCTEERTDTALGAIKGALQRFFGFEYESV